MKRTWGDRLENNLKHLMEEAKTPNEKLAAQIAAQLLGLIKAQQMQLNLLARSPSEGEKRLSTALEE
jgi:hypothetical protein